MSSNILIISLDTVRADHLSCYGYKRETTPFLNDFSTQSMRFEYAYSAANWTLPSHISMMTGMSMNRHGIGSDSTGERKLSNPRIITLAEYLRALGYETAAFTNCGYLSRATLFDRGFNYFNFVEDLVDKTHPFYTSRIFGKYWARAASGFYYRHLYRRKDQGAARTFRLFREYLDHRWNGSQPFFGFLHFFEAHAPYHVPSRFSGAYSPDSKERSAMLNLHKNPWYHLTGAQKISPSQFHEMIDAYDGALIYIDQILQQIVEFLESKKILDNTIIIITSDHGEALGEHGSVGHAGDSLSESVIRIPMILYIPERNYKNNQPSTPVTHIDIFPTVLKLIGVKDSSLDQQVQGTDMLELADGVVGKSDRVVVAESLTIPLEGIKALAPEIDLVEFDKYLRAVRTGRHKLIVSSLGHKKLFDIFNDPEEVIELADSQPDTIGMISDMLDDWLSSVSPVQTISPLEDAEFDSNIRQRLVNLGYLE